MLGGFLPKIAKTGAKSNRIFPGKAGRDMALILQYFDRPMAKAFPGVNLFLRLLEWYLLWKFYSGELGPPKKPFHGCWIGTKNFDNLWLDKHKCYAHETHHYYVSSRDLQFGKRFLRDSINS